MMNFVMQLKKEVNEKVRIVKLMNINTMQKSLESSDIYGEAFDQLKEFITRHEFKDEAEEIYFFKHVKPLICSHLIYTKKYIISK